MTIFIVILFLLLVFYLWWNHFKTPGLPRKQDDIKKIIKELIDRGFNDGYLLLTHAKTKYFLQFYKYAAIEKKGIVLSIPVAKWSEPFIDKIKSYLDKEKIVYTLEVGGDGSSSMTFVDVDFLCDEYKAAVVVKYIFNDIFNVPESDNLYVRLLNASIS